MHAHDVRADDHPRWHQDQRDPRSVEIEVDIRTLPGQTAADIAQDARRRARRSRGARRHHAVRRERVDGVTRRHADVGCDGARVVAAGRGLVAGAVPHGRRDRRAVLPPRGLDRLRLRPVQPARCRSTTTRRCSTATTSGSTSSPSCCRPNSGTASPATSSTRSRCRTPASHVGVRVARLFVVAGRGGSARSRRRGSRPTAGRPRRTSRRRRRLPLVPVVVIGAGLERLVVARLRGARRSC